MAPRAGGDLCQVEGGAEADGRLDPAGPHGFGKRYRPEGVSPDGPQKRDYALAGQWANQGLEIDVSDGELHSIIAEAAGERHNQQEAIEEYEIAVELSPTDPRPRLGLADALFKRARPRRPAGCSASS